VLDRPCHEEKVMNLNKQATHALERILKVVQAYGERLEADQRNDPYAMLLVFEDIATLRAAFDPDAPPAQTDTVRMPTTADEAAAMVLVGAAWLKEHAPDRLKAPAQTEHDWEAIAADRALTIALMRAERMPLTDDDVDRAYREIWRGLPSDFDHTSAAWIEAGIRWAEQQHGITGEQPCK
jgi:hypothetical protein